MVREMRSTVKETEGDLPVTLEENPGSRFTHLNPFSLNNLSFFNIGFGVRSVGVQTAAYVALPSMFLTVVS